MIEREIERVKADCERLNEAFPSLDSFKGQMARQCLELIDHIDKISKGVIEVLPSDRQRALFMRMECLEMLALSAKKFMDRFHDDPGCIPHKFSQELHNLQCTIANLDINTIDQRVIGGIPMTDEKKQEAGRKSCAKVCSACARHSRLYTCPQCYKVFCAGCFTIQGFCQECWLQRYEAREARADRSSE